MKNSFLIVYLLLLSIGLFAQEEEKKAKLDDLKENILLRAELEKEELVIGEQVTLNLTIYTKIGIEQIEIIKDFELIGNKGLYIHENRKVEFAAAEKTLDGEQYKSRILAQYLIDPWVEGMFKLETPIVLIACEKTEEEVAFFNPFSFVYDSLTIEKPLFINVVAPKDKESQYAAKNGLGMTSRYNDSLIEKGIVIVDLELYGKGTQLFYSPPHFDLGDAATVEVGLLEDNEKLIDNVLYASRSYRYVLSFHKKGDYKLRAAWKTFDTKNETWKIDSSEIYPVQIKNTCNRKDSIIDTLPIKVAVNSLEDIVFVVDLSSSMLAKDIVPNRLEAVKNLLKEMVRQKEAAQQVGLVVFAGEAMVLCPLTLDTSVLLKSIEMMEVDKLESGTALGNGLMFGLYELSKSNHTEQYLFVLTDGVQNAGVYAAEMVAQIANKNKVKIHSFGVGCNGQAMTPVARKPEGGFIYEMADVVIDENILRLIGEQTGGVYSRVTCNSDLKNIGSLKELIAKAKTNQGETVEFPDELIEKIWQNVELNNAKAELKYWK